MPAMLQEGGYLFQQEASQQGIRGEVSAPIAIWSIPERRPEHELNLLSINTLASTSFQLQRQTPDDRTRGYSRELEKLDANEASGATVKCAWVIP